MIAVNQRHGTSNILEVSVSGKLIARDYEYLIPQVEKMVAECGKIRILLHMVEFHGWTLAAAWQDAKFALRHFSAISKIAMVGDKDWENGMSKFCKPFTRAEIRFFDRSEREEALRWLESPGKERLQHAIG